MNFSNELTSWLRMSLTGAVVYAHYARAHEPELCRLCSMPHAELNDAMPCLHWLVHPYCRQERAKAVLASFALVDVVRYLLIWTRAHTRRPSSSVLRCLHRADTTDIVIGLRQRSWRVALQGWDATFFYSNGRSSHGFALPVELYLGEAAALHQLVRCHAPQENWGKPAAVRPAL